MKKLIETILTFGIIFYLTILITSCPNYKKYYVAIGDSVSAGYGVSHEESYPAIFYCLVKKDQYVNNYVNMAANGFTTTMLLDHLNNLNPKELRIFNNSKIITLNIGGNDLLIPFTHYLSNQRKSGTENIKAGAESILLGTLGVISGIKSEIKSIISNPDDNRTMNTGITSGIDNIITGVENIISGTGEVILSSPAIFSISNSPLSPQLKDVLLESIQTFYIEFLGIIAWLEINAPNATIIVNNVYNPVAQSSLEFSIAVNMLIDTMNDIIIQESKTRTYLVTDVYTHLSRLNMMNFNINPFNGELNLDVIHPNAKGHELIAQLNYETLKNK